MKLVVTQIGDRLRVGVEDDSPTMPVLASPSVRALGGRGLQLVAGLSGDWGVARRANGRPGKRVWFELP